MKKEMRLRDFQIGIGTTGNIDLDGAINIAHFASFEIVRLWLKARRIKAPFSKLLVSMTNEATIDRLEGHVMNLFGVCDVRIAVDYSAFPESATDHRQALARILHALPYVEQHTDWRSPELEDFIAATALKELPLIHFFDHLTRSDRKTKMKCVPWFSTLPTGCKVGVRLIAEDGTQRDVTVLSALKPIYLEDDFPLAKSAIRGSDFVLLDRAGNVLAGVPIEEPGRAWSVHQPYVRWGV